jgi:hypothetical protein
MCDDQTVPLKNTTYTPCNKGKLVGAKPPPRGEACLVDWDPIDN